VKEASRMVAAEVRPIDDFRAKADYRRAMTGALLQKALRQITDISS
jgi:CO/xanthine dehydrogenase FAD-binding subunit